MMAEPAPRFRLCGTLVLAAPQAGHSAVGSAQHRGCVCSHTTHTHTHRQLGPWHPGAGHSGRAHPCNHCIGRAEMSFQSLLLFCLCSTAFVSQLFLMLDFCGKNDSAKPPRCLLHFRNCPGCFACTPVFSRSAVERSTLFFYRKNQKQFHLLVHLDNALKLADPFPL